MKNILIYKSLTLIFATLIVYLTFGDTIIENKTPELDSFVYIHFIGYLFFFFFFFIIPVEAISYSYYYL